MLPTPLPITICKIRTPEGVKALVTLSPDNAAFERGLLPEEIIGQLIQAEVDSISPENFARNRAFVDFLHETISKRGPESPGLIYAARNQKEGWVHIIDGRTPTPQGAVPSEDVIGAFEVRGGNIVAGSYQENPNHRILSQHGFF